VTGETFGALLRRLRVERTMIGPAWPGTWSGRVVERMLSQNELGRRSDVDVALVNRLESDKHPGQVRRETVEKLADGLDLSPLDRDRLLIAAGYWPWRDQAEDVERALAAVHGDFYGERRRTG
jgi:transcriptional regulator with XRE-family HTH domain